VKSILSEASNSPHCFFIVSKGIIETPMAYVIAPASVATIAVPLIKSRIVDLPSSTWPNTEHMGERVFCIA
jgi:hypothetical protein